MYSPGLSYYNILNIAVNTERDLSSFDPKEDYNILNIAVNTELAVVNTF